MIIVDRVFNIILYRKTAIKFNIKVRQVTGVYHTIIIRTGRTSFYEKKKLNRFNAECCCIPASVVRLIHDLLLYRCEFFSNFACFFFFLCKFCNILCALMAFMEVNCYFAVLVGIQTVFIEQFCYISTFSLYAYLININLLFFFLRFPLSSCLKKKKQRRPARFCVLRTLAAICCPDGQFILTSCADIERNTGRHECTTRT